MAALKRFKSSLGKKAYATNDFRNGLQLLPSKQALNHKNVSLNQRLVHYLAFDIDHTNPIAWQDACLPQPTLNIISNDNLHSHCLYELKTPFPKTLKANQKVIQWAAGIERGYQRRLEADKNYAGLIVKNPMHKQWRLITHDRTYSLAELDNSLDFEDKAHRIKSELSGLGRNCDLFDRLRVWAYRNVPKYNSYQKWRLEVFTKAHELNDFAFPLPINEVKHTANSVMKWTWNRKADFDYNPDDPFRDFSFETVNKMNKEIEINGLPFRGKYKGVYERTGLSVRTVSDYINVYVKNIVNNYK